MVPSISRATHNGGTYNTVTGFISGDRITFTQTRTGEESGSSFFVNSQLTYASEGSSLGSTFSTTYIVGIDDPGTTVTEKVGYFSNFFSSSSDTFAVTATCAPAGSPVVTQATPNSGPIAGGTAVTITGTNFFVLGNPTTGVSFGGTAATSFTVVDNNTITAVTPAHAAGATSVAVTNGVGTGTGAGLFTYIAPVGAPTVTAISPNTGSTSGGTSVTITGTNLTGASAVTIGGVTVMAFTVVNATTITATTAAHAAGSVDVVVTTPGGSGTGAGLFTYAVPTTATALSSSQNPSRPGVSVTFTATVTSSGGTPTGAVTFSDGGVALGTVALAGGVATLTTSALALGSHPITAAYAGNLGSSSTALTQTVSNNQDSQQLRALQIFATKVVAQNSGAAISTAIDNAITEGFDGGGQMFSPSAGSMRFNFSADPDQQSASATEAGASRGYAANSKSRVDDALASINRNTMPAKAPARYTESKDWLLWADVRGSGIDRWNSSSAAPSMLYGDQVNALIGLTRRLGPSFLLGVVGGYENFNYTSDVLNGHLKGDGWTAGGYLGWRFAPGLRFDAAAAYSGINYNGVAGTAAGNFDGRRWLVSGGVTGNYKAYGLDIEPSARVYALWEDENTYVDSLGTAQASRSFFTGRSSAGVKVSAPWLYSGMVTVSPYAGIYADYYFNGDNAAAVVLASAPVVIGTALDGWSARAVGGVTARFTNGASLGLGAELGGIGGNYQVWTFKGRGSVPF